jgi:Mn2+/Fe2+ NRAMP family transporter
MNWWHTPISSPYYYLVLGVIFFLAAVVSTCTGKTYARYVRGPASRAKNPSEFWWTVAIYYIAGICFIAYFLCKVCGLLN